MYDEEISLANKLNSERIFIPFYQFAHELRNKQHKIKILKAVKNIRKWLNHYSYFNFNQLIKDKFISVNRDIATEELAPISMHTIKDSNWSLEV
jgi:hypothetical protein